MYKLLDYLDYHHQRKEDANYRIPLKLPTNFSKDAKHDQGVLISALLKVGHFCHYFHTASFLAQKYHQLLKESAQD